MKMLIPILFLLSPGWVEAAEPSAAIPKAELYRTTEFETWEELEKQIVPLADLEHATFADVIRVCRSAQIKKPDEGGIVFADAPPELAGKKIDFEWSKQPTGEMAVSGLIRLAVEKGKTTLVREGRRVSFKPMDYAVAEREKPFSPEETEVKQRLEKIIIPRVDFRNTTISEALDFIRMRNAGCGDFIERPKRDAILVLDPKINEARIRSLCLLNVTLWNALHIFAGAAGAELDIVEKVVVFFPLNGKRPEFRKDGQGKAMERADKLILPRATLTGYSLKEAVELFNIRISENKELDGLLGVSLGKTVDENAVLPSFDFRNVPLGTALRFTALVTGNPLVSDDIVIVIGEQAAMQNQQAGVFEARIRERLEKETIPRVDFQDTTLAGAVDAILMRYAEICTESGQPKRVNVAVVPELRDHRVALQLKETSTWQVYTLLAEQCGARLEFEEDLVRFIPASAPPTPSRARLMEDAEEELAPAILGRSWMIAKPITLDSMQADDNSLGEMVYFFNHWLWKAGGEAENVTVQIDPALDPEMKVPDIFLSNVPFTIAVNRLAKSAGLEVRYEDERIVFMEKILPVAVEFPTDEADIPPLMANLRWIVAGGVACVVGFSFWMTRRMVRA